MCKLKIDDPWHEFVFMALHHFQSNQMASLWPNLSLVLASEIIVILSTVQIIILFHKIMYLLINICISVWNYLAQIRTFSHFGSNDIIENSAIHFTESAISFGKYKHASFCLSIPYLNFSNLIHVHNSNFYFYIWE